MIFSSIAPSQGTSPFCSSPGDQTPAQVPKYGL
jgi:hypothetical protein